MENADDKQSEDQPSAGEEQIAEFSYRQLLPVILPTIAGVIGGIWFATQIRNFATGLVACGLALAASVLALAIAGRAQTVILNHWAVGASGGFAAFFIMAIALLGYPWFILLGLIIWLIVGALVARHIEKSESS